MSGKYLAACLGAMATIPFLLGVGQTPGISGHYLETRSCDVYTGPCFANGEMGQTGKEAIMVWKVSDGHWQGTDLDGLSVIAVVHTEHTMGDLRYDPRYGKAVLLVDETATETQREALAAYAQHKAGNLIKSVVAIQSTPISAELGTCTGSGCATVTAGDLVEVRTRCMGVEDHVCGNERTFYPPLIEVDNAYPVYTEVAAYQGDGLDLTWADMELRGTFLATFAN